MDTMETIEVASGLSMEVKMLVAVCVVLATMLVLTMVSSYTYERQPAPRDRGRAACADRVATADGVAHPHGGRAGDPERQHERHRSQVEGDLVPRDLVRAVPTHRDAGERDGSEGAGKAAVCNCSGSRNPLCISRQRQCEPQKGAGVERAEYRDSTTDGRP